jgi:hypothetical protein
MQLQIGESTHAWCLSGKTTLEVKSGRRRNTMPGIEAFARVCQPIRKWLVGGQGIPLEEFLSSPAAR